MTDFINREDALNAIVSATIYDNADAIEIMCDASVCDSEGWLGGIRDALRAIENVPSADLERTVQVTDTWKIGGFDELNAWCPECEHRITRGCSYCPTCGVKLDWGGHE